MELVVSDEFVVDGQYKCYEHRIVNRETKSTIGYVPIISDGHIRSVVDPPYEVRIEFEFRAAGESVEGSQERTLDGDEFFDAYFPEEFFPVGSPPSGADLELKEGLESCELKITLIE